MKKLYKPFILFLVLLAGCAGTASAQCVTISGPAHVCAGDSVVLTASTAGGTWTTNSTAIASIGSSSGVITGVALGNVQVTYSLPSGCVGAMSFTVNPVAPILGHDSVCVGTDGYLTDIVGGGTWTSAITAVATVRPDSGKVTGVAAGVTTISYQLPTGCLSTVSMTVISFPGAVTGTMQVCPGTTTSLGNTTGGGSWSSANTAVATVDPYSGTVTGVFADTVSILYSIKPGCPVTAVITVNPLPDVISGPLAVCPATTDTLHDATPGGLWTSSATPVVTIVDTNGVFSALTGGTSFIQYILPTGCAQTVLVSVDPVPSPVIFYDYLQNTFYATPGFATYQWYDSAQGKIPHATASTLAAPATQYYYVTVSDSNGCKGQSALYHFDIHSVGVNNYQNNSQVRIYPNPAANIVYVASPVKVRAMISSMDGRKEIDVTDVTDPRAIDISMLPVGLHMITLFDGAGTRITVQKLVKE